MEKSLGGGLPLASPVIAATSQKSQGRFGGHGCQQDKNEVDARTILAAGDEMINYFAAFMSLFYRSN